MSAKLLYSISDENPDLQKQIGCMNGIFQLFDGHHFFPGRRIHQNHKRLPPAPGDNHVTKPNTASQPPTKGKNPKKDMKEKRKLSTESSRTSFSSSSCSSSFSSVDCNKQSLPESSSNGRINIFGTPSGDLLGYQPNHSSRHPVDIRNVVKDSMYREARELSIRTASKENKKGQTLKYMDSPRPLQQPKSVKGKGSGVNESFQVLSKLREAAWSSNGQKDSFAAKDAPRFSYDGRETREGFKSTIKLKELPRLSLDSRERSMRSSTTEMKSNYLTGDLQRVNGNSNILNQQQEPGSNKRPSSVVAKLMGLEAFPDSTSTNEDQPKQIKIFQDVDCGSFPRLSRKTDENKQNQISGSSRNSIKGSLLHQVKNVNAIKKPIASSKFPIEPAPWKQPNTSKGQTPALKCRETPTTVPSSSLSVYGEMEKRLAELEFKKSGKDLRALKQILEAMQKTKEILKSRNDDQISNFGSQTSNNNSVDQSSKLANSEKLISSDPTSTTIKGTSSPKSFRSPNVIMKASRSIAKASNCASPAIQNESPSGLQRLHIVDYTASRKESVDNRTKDRTPRTNHQRDPSSRPINKNANTKSLRSAQTPKGSHPTTGNTSSGKSFEPMNPRLQQKELSFEKQSHSRTPSSDFIRSRGQPMELGSPRTKSRAKSSHLQQSSDQLSDININMRDLSHQGDATSLQSESCISTSSNIECEVTSTDRSNKSRGALFLQHDQKDPVAGYIEDRTMAEPTRAGPEQPSPVSVLDATFYRDEPPSPLKTISHAFKDDEALNFDDAEWSLMDFNHFSFENNNKLENTRYLDQDDMPIKSTHEGFIINGTAPIYDSTNPNHRYISEILLASGLLRGFESDFLTMLLHPSGHLINPNLFFVLEQTKASTELSNSEQEAKNMTCPESTTEKAQRKLVFDAVNDILVQKLVLQESSKKWSSPSKLANKRYSGQKLLRDLCSEVDRLQAINSDCYLNDEDDSLGCIIWEDLMHGSMDWMDCQSEIPWLVLDVERLIFKDLINDIIHNETASMKGHPGRHCRKLFSK